MFPSEPEIFLDEICEPRGAQIALMRKTVVPTREIRRGALGSVRVDSKDILRVRSSPEREGRARKSRV
jgi:hypothetical protein